MEDALSPTEPRAYIKGKCITQKCGLNCTAIEYADNNHVQVKWEDDTISIVNKTQFSHGKAIHPKLRYYKHSLFCNFDVIAIPGISETQYLYDCTCKHCSHTYIMTPQQMIAHNKEHMNLKEPQEN